MKLNLGLTWQKLHLTVRRLFSQANNLNFRKKLVKCCVWSIALYGAETWTLKVDQKILKSLNCGARKGWISSGPVL
jgi:hypothetical protein